MFRSPGLPLRSLDAVLVAALPGYPGRLFPLPVPPGCSSPSSFFPAEALETLRRRPFRFLVLEPLQVCVQPLSLLPLPAEGDSPHHFSRSVGRLRDWSECKLTHAKRLVNMCPMSTKPNQINGLRRKRLFSVHALVLCTHGCCILHNRFVEHSQKTGGNNNSVGDSVRNRTHQHVRRSVLSQERH